VRHRCAQLSDMGIRLRGLTSLCAQKWEGDINITLPITFSQVKMINPTKLQVDLCVTSVFRV
jgi:TAG lipase/steryl ester hydrolase/phospholipase A2/LPA acyltransferase